MKTSQEKMLEILKQVKMAGTKPRLLLHSCCAPCSGAVIEQLNDYFCLTVFYYNPNILPKEEYEIRKAEQQRYLNSLGIDFIEGDYLPTDYFDAIKGLENLGEKTLRCYNCYKLRLAKTMQYAVKHNFEYFCTTLTVSPHKKQEWVNQIGENLATQTVKFLPSDFKKNNGYLRSVQISKQNNFYRQKYCGCGLKKSKE